MERIRCPAPLPEDSANPVLTRMLASAPYQAPAREGEEESEKTRDDLCSRSKSDTESGEIDLSSPEYKGEKEPASLLRVGGKGPPPKVGRGDPPKGARCHC